MDDYLYFTEMSMCFCIAGRSTDTFVCVRFLIFDLQETGCGSYNGNKIKKGSAYKWRIV